MTRKHLLVLTIAITTASTEALAQEPADGDCLASDSDGDGVPDEVERFLGTDPARADTDRDGVADGVEVLMLRTDPVNPDTDGDGWCDGAGEIEGFCRRGEDLNGDGLRGAEETDPLCNNDAAAEVGPSVSGTTVFGCSASANGATPSFFLVLTFTFTALRARRRERRQA